MGQLRFAAPLRDRLPAGAIEQAYLTGMEAVPFPSRNRAEGDQFVVVREVRESGSLHILWHVPGRGPLLLSTASLMERERPYLLPIELARGTLNRLRNQLAQWQALGLTVPRPFEFQLHDALLEFGRAATQQSNPLAACQAAEKAIALALSAGESLANAYIDQVLALRHEQTERLATILGSALPQQTLTEPGTRLYLNAFNAAVVPFKWRAIEPAENEFDWKIVDRQFQWLKGKSLKVCSGPLLRLDATELPDWLYLWEDDFEAIQGYVQQYITAVVTRYRGQVQVWQCAAGLNLPGGLHLSEEQKLRLAVMTIDAVRRADPRTPVVMAFDQPWGEYLQQEEMDLPPYHFADALVRADLGLAGVTLEMNVGYTPGGTLPRDVLEVGRLIDRWSTLGVPILAALTAPSESGTNSQATSKATIVGSDWTAAVQAQRLASWFAMLLAKQAIHGVLWNQFADSEAQHWPHSGLLDAGGAAKPILQVLAELRKQHLA